MHGRNTLLSLIACACIAAVILAGCTSPAAKPAVTPAPVSAATGTPPPVEKDTFGMADRGGTYPVSLDAPVQLRLPENPTTGYTWNLSITQGLSLINDTYIPDDTTGRLVGAGGTHVWFLRAIQPGNQGISGIYRRPREPVTGNETDFNLTLRVEENACGGNVCALPPAPPAASRGKGIR